MSLCLATRKPDNTSLKPAGTRDVRSLPLSREWRCNLPKSFVGSSTFQTEKQACYERFLQTFKINPCQLSGSISWITLQIQGVPIVLLAPCDNIVGYHQLDEGTNQKKDLVDIKLWVHPRDVSQKIS